MKETQEKNKKKNTKQNKTEGKLNRVQIRFKFPISRFFLKFQQINSKKDKYDIHFLPDFAKTFQITFHQIVYH